MKGRRLKSIIICCLLIGIIGFALVGYEMYSLIFSPMLINASGPTTLVIDRKTTAVSFAQMLQSRHLIKSSHAFLNLIRYKGLARRLKAGVYEIKPGETVWQLLKNIKEGKTMIFPFRIIEGTTLTQVIGNLHNAPYLKYDEKDWQSIIRNRSTAEGLLLADTYNYEGGSEAKFLLRLAAQKLQEYLALSWANRSEGLPYKSSYDMLIVASILEKESSLPEERKLISGVIINRLKNNMPLQMDPTVIYALRQNYTGKLSHENMSINSSYNTYVYRGLPPTPIAMVSKNAIDAAAHPQLNNYLYFVAKGDGSHQFSTNYEKQKEAITRYQVKKVI